MFYGKEFIRMVCFSCQLAEFGKLQVACSGGGLIPPGPIKVGICQTGFGMNHAVHTFAMLDLQVLTIHLKKNHE
jgi:hypothetical protein